MISKSQVVYVDMINFKRSTHILEYNAHGVQVGDIQQALSNFGFEYN